ncbi:MAG: FAD-dependent oxidoreductase [Candidatus Nanoarchaeia archaeon]|nr:FAD-dependent oxidoreductase [Candidatus Nanoarchaeia archaeon]
MKKTSKCDFLIIGAGGTGLSSAMYAARLGLKTLVLGTSHGSELPIGGVITTTDSVENFPGFKRISGMELIKKIEGQARSYKLVTIKEERALKIERKKDCFFVKTNKGTYQARTILLATGTKWRKLDVPGSLKFERHGVNYCALCDAPLYRNKVAAVIGSGDSAVKEALLLAEYAKKVYLIVRGEKVHPEPVNLERLKKNKKIEVVLKTQITEIRGDNTVNKVIIDNPYKGKKELSLDGVFVAIGHIPISDLAKSAGVKLNEKGEIIIDYETAETNVKGIFAAGDVTDKKFKQLIIGVADGCSAAYHAYEYITKNKVITC